MRWYLVTLMMLAAAPALAAPCNEDKADGDDGLETELQRKYVGQVVFAKKPVDRLKAVDADLAKTFVATDTLYLRVYLAHSLSNTCIFNAEGGQLNQTGGYRVTLTVDGKAEATPMAFRQLSTQAAARWTTFSMAFNPAASDTGQAHDDQARWADILAALAPGKHTVRVEVWAAADAAGALATKKPIAAGELTVTKKAGDAIGSAGLPAPAKRDAALEKAMLAALKDAGWEETPLKAIITDDNWITDRNELGQIVGRTIGATVAVKAQGGKCRKFSLSFEQEHQGGSKYGSTHLKGTGDSSDIPCSAVGK